MKLYFVKITLLSTTERCCNHKICICFLDYLDQVVREVTTVDFTEASESRASVRGFAILLIMGVVSKCLFSENSL